MAQSDDTAKGNKKLNIQFRPTEAIEAKLRERNGNPHQVARRDLERYYYLLDFRLSRVRNHPEIHFTVDEWPAIIVALKGWEPDVASTRLLWAVCADAGVEGSIVERLRKLNAPQYVALLDAAERCHQLDPQLSWEERLRAVGLIN